MSSAKTYETSNLRNVVVVGHGGSGKSTLIDALCFVTGTSRRHGNVKDGTALTMYAEEEVGHGISIQVSVAFADWNGIKVNLLDTPGYLDFTGEAVAATRVADGAVITLGATTGVEVGTEKVWDYTVNRGIPRLFFISMMDKENANFDKVVEEIREHMSDKAVVTELPIGVVHAHCDHRGCDIGLGSIGTRPAGRAKVKILSILSRPRPLAHSAQQTDRLLPVRSLPCEPAAVLTDNEPRLWPGPTNQRGTGECHPSGPSAGARSASKYGRRNNSARSDSSSGPDGCSPTGRW